MNPPTTLKTRREFLRTTLLGGAVSWTVPAFIDSTFTALNSEAADKGPQAASRDGRIVVLLQIAGGNDGLNTIVPFTNDHYYKARPTIGLQARSLIKLTRELGLHPSLAGLRSLIVGGQLAVVQGVGYPNPNRSHFRGTDIWATASDADKFVNTGWLGRYFDNACAGADPTVGIAVSRQRPLSFAGKSGKGINVDNPDNYRFMVSSKDDAGTMATTQQSYRELNQSSSTMAADAAASINYVKRVALDVQVSSDQIIARSKSIENKAKYPSSQLGNSLKLIARWIAGGMPTRVYYASQGGYDTHINQPPAHERLLKDLGDSIQAFTDDLKALGHFNRVLLMTFSEFGRRVKENASTGTDHGAGSMLFVVAPKVKSSLLGKYPSLAPADLHQGDLKYNVDFRQVYAGVLEGWLQTPSQPILGQQFEPLALV
ncbi:MAG: DUF1501 domain-containing protein [Verrucomicrobiota bacterium]